VKPVSKATFYKYMSDSIFKDMKKSTCCCEECVRGDEAIENMRTLVANVGHGEDARELLHDIDNLKHFLKFNYKNLMEESCVEVQRCLTHALSEQGGGPFSQNCDHTHIDECAAF
jgi:hypothetical protein